MRGWCSRGRPARDASHGAWNASGHATVSRASPTRWGRPARLAMTTEIKAELITALGGKGISRPGWRRPVPRAKVARMIKRLFAVFSLLVIALPSLAAAQGVTSSADPRATAAGREL